MSKTWQSQGVGEASPFNLRDGYLPIAGVHDEMLDATGFMRPAWRGLINKLNALGPEGLRGRFADADRYLRDTGVFYRVYGGDNASERPWQLSHIPLLIRSAEWQFLEEGLIQRANLCEAILADLYGPQRLIGDGSLPAPVVAANPEFLRPFVNTAPQGGHHLHLFAVDLGRGPDGQWWVLGDRTQAPSGLGFALENRLAMRRAIPGIAHENNVRQLAGFFQELRDSLNSRSQLTPPGAALLTPGPYNELYFEHAFLARYLGLSLVEGGDLTVRGETVYARTVAGLKPVDVLYRRMDGCFLDPLELNPASQIGVPGLVSAIRAQNLALANNGGSGLIEARAMLAFMPQLCRRLLGQDLKLPNVATWWLGDDTALERALADHEPRVFAKAFGPALPGGRGDGYRIGSDDNPGLAEDIRSRAMDWVAQEIVHLSSLPVPTDNGLQPRPFILRVFMTRRTDGNWQLMPGGFCRVADGTDARAISLQDGSLSADVWVCGDQPERAVSLIDVKGEETIRRAPAILPARAAENLFWLGRYMERAEQAMRLLAAHHARILGSLVDEDPLIALLEEKLAFIGIEDARAKDVFMVGIGSILNSARVAASAIRDRFSPDAWQLVNETAQWANRVGAAPFGAGPEWVLDHTSHGLRMMAGFSGLAAENMSRLVGWRFLEIGRRLERGILTSRQIAALGHDKAPPGALDLLLELTDSIMTYRQRYSISPRRFSVLDLVMLDHNNPRSLAFQAEIARKHIEALPGRRETDAPSRVVQESWRLQADLRTINAVDLDNEQLQSFWLAFARIAGDLADRFFAESGAQPNEEGGRR